MLTLIKRALCRWGPRTRAVGPREPVGSVAVNMRPTTSSWGGGNQWLAQIVRYLAARGYAVRFDLVAPVDVIVMVDPRVGGLIGFGPDEILTYRRRSPAVAGRASRGAGPGSRPAPAPPAARRRPAGPP